MGVRIDSWETPLFLGRGPNQADGEREVREIERTLGRTVFPNPRGEKNLERVNLSMLRKRQVREKP